MVFHESSGWTFVSRTPRQGNGSIVAAVAEDSPDERHVLAVLCEGRGPRPTDGTDRVMAELPDQLASRWYGHVDSGDSMRRAVVDIDVRMRSHGGEALLGVVHVGPDRIVTTMVGDMRAFLLGEGRADELAPARSLDARGRMMGVRATPEPCDPDIVSVERTFEHPFLLLATANVLGVLEVATYAPGTLVRPGDTVITLRDRIGEALGSFGTTDGAALVLALTTKSA